MRSGLVKILALTGLMVACGCSSSKEDPSMFGAILGPESYTTNAHNNSNIKYSEK